jgi:hypothetical protein
MAIEPLPMPKCDAIICHEHHTPCDKPAPHWLIVGDNERITDQVAFMCDHHIAVPGRYHPRHRRLASGILVREFKCPACDKVLERVAAPDADDPEVQGLIEAALGRHKCPRT